MTSFTLTYGLRETKRPSKFKYDQELLSESGPYGQALSVLKAYIKTHWTNAENPDQLTYEVIITLIHECEQAKAWLDRFVKDQEDYETARVAHQSRMRARCMEALAALDQLIVCDREAPYFLRSAFSSGLCSVVPAASDVDYTIPDQNRDDGGFRVKSDGQTRRVIEQQFAMRSTARDLDAILIRARKALENWGASDSNEWHQIGNLRFEPPLSAKSRAGIRKANDAALGTAILGLAVSLSAWFRHWSAGKAKEARWVGASLSLEGKPSWSLVATFVNCTFPVVVETEESLRQRVSTISRKHKIRIMPWPQPAIREAKISEN